MSNKKKQVVPSVQGDAGYRLSNEAIEQINVILRKKRKDNKDPECDWCGKTDWGFSGVVYTNTFFDISLDSHEHSKVFPFISLVCNNCGNMKQFFLPHFGYVTKGGAE